MWGHGGCGERVFFGMAVTGEILALLMFRFSKRAA